MKIVAHVLPHETKYGHSGYDVFAVGFATFFAHSIKEVREFCAEHGLDYIRV